MAIDKLCYATSKFDVSTADLLGCAWMVCTKGTVACCIAEGLVSGHAAQTTNLLATTTQNGGFDRPRRNNPG